MAEFVEFRAEEWVTELEQMERIRLFEPKEIKTIASKRKEFEYKIQRRTKCKEDYLKYIQFEVNLQRIIKARREKTGIKIKKAEIDHSQTNRIGNLFKVAIFRFQNDVKLWMSFFKFCQDVKFHSLVSQMLVRMLQIHSDKPVLWAFAAKWEFQQCGSVENARQFLTRGLRHHPSCETLYKDLFSLELDHIKQKEREIEKEKREDENWVPDEVTNSIMEGSVAEVVYKSAVQAIPGIDFKVDLLKIAKHKKAPISLRDKIFWEVAESKSEEELAWDAMAQREVEVLSCGANESAGGENPEGRKELQKKVSARDRIQRSVAVYEEAVRKLNTSKMWGLYLDHVLKLNRDPKQLTVYKARLLKSAMEGALASGNMAEKYYLEWIDILRKEGKRSKALSEVLRRGTEEHPGSLPLWYARLRFHLSRDREEEGRKVFEEAILHLPEGVPLWKLMVKYLLLKSPATVEKVLKEGMERRGEVAQALKAFYVEWVAQTKGMPEARRLLVSPEMNLPPCLQLYRKMAALEASQSPPSAENLRKCHELAVTYFGGTDADVWLDYVRFELRDGDATKVAHLHRRALKSLPEDLADDFVGKFNDEKLRLSC